jgi:hypothetical protein
MRVNSGRRPVRTSARLLALSFIVSGVGGVRAMPPEVTTDAKPAQPAVAETYAAYIQEAALRFQIPEYWIRAVMRRESGFDAHAVSNKGAIRLMQLMPRTWNELRSRYGLGVDPFDPHDNSFAGTAYLRELYDRFGMEGFLAAYHAGPERYVEHLASGRPLPEETIAYVATLLPIVQGVANYGPNAGSDRSNWQSASVFPAHLDDRLSNSGNKNSLFFASASERKSIKDLSALSPSRDGLFVVNSTARELLPSR